ncbi:MAG: hypothetical protein M3P46_09540 [Actinomycetota bacterium]|nr:hypothetical protein [Actinomycetota bacterium]
MRSPAAATARSRAAIRSGVQWQRPEVMFAKEDGPCTVGGEKVEIVLYQNIEQRTQIAQAFGSLQSGYDVDGHQPWTVYTQTSDAALRQQLADPRAPS